MSEYSDNYGHVQDQKEFWMGVGWDEDEAERIATACRVPPKVPEYRPLACKPAPSDREAWAVINRKENERLKLRDEADYISTARYDYIQYPENCLDLRHPMFWHARGYEIGESVERAVLAAATLGKVPPDPPKPDLAMQMLERLVMAKMQQQSDIQALPYCTNRFGNLDDDDSDPMDVFNPDDFPRFGQ